jgi:AcrR family transcriptional regulator
MHQIDTTSIMTASNENLSKSDRKHRNQRLMMIQAARRLFEQKEYDEVSMEDIADEAAVSKQTLYNYFSSKEAIYFGIGIEDFEDLLERSVKAINSGLNGRNQILKLCSDFFDGLREFPFNAEIGRRFTITNNQMNGIANTTLETRAKKKRKSSEKKRNLEDVLADYLEQIRKFEDIWTTAITNGFKDGTVNSKLSAEQLFQYASVIIWGTIDQMQLKRIPLDRVKLDDTMIRQLTLQVIERLLVT